MRLDQMTPGEGLAGAALAASERARARSLLESLAEARVDLVYPVRVGPRHVL